jgi:hypothetical protein
VATPLLDEIFALASNFTQSTELLRQFPTWISVLLLPYYAALLSQIGLRRTWQINHQPWVRMQIVNPVGETLPCNTQAEVFCKNNVNLVHYFDPNHETLDIIDSRYQRLGFQPQFVQTMSGFKFVYLAPNCTTAVAPDN